MSSDNSEIDAIKAFLEREFAPMILQLGINPQSLSDTGAQFNVPVTDFMVRGGDIVCGQAIASIADTVGVLTLFGHNPTERLLTTVDMTTHFMRPLTNGVMEIDTRILSNGRRLATVFIEFRQQGSTKPAATSTCAYAYLNPEG
ncbi:MAG: PaaI family thioesterase [Rhizobiaceae bacterium]